VSRKYFSNRETKKSLTYTRPIRTTVLVYRVVANQRNRSQHAPYGPNAFVGSKLGRIRSNVSAVDLTSTPRKRVRTADDETRESVQIFAPPSGPRQSPPQTPRRSRYFLWHGSNAVSYDTKDVVARQRTMFYACASLSKFRQTVRPWSRNPIATTGIKYDWKAEIRLNSTNQIT